MHGYRSLITMTIATVGLTAGCKPAASQDRHDKISLDVDGVTDATIGHEGTTRKLERSSLEDFARNWQAADRPMADKYLWDYTVSLTLKDGKKRVFLIKGAKVQEASWLTWHFDSASYAAGLWEKAR